MNTGDMSKLDQEIAQLERRLSILHSQRLTVLEQQVRDAQERIKALGGSAKAAPAEAPAARAFSPKKESVKVAPVPARRGRPPGPKTAAKTGGKRKRTRTPSDVVNQKILSTVKEGGEEGLSQKDISTRSGLNYQTTAKKLRELKEIVKKGAGKNARYFLRKEEA
jgi:TolA-binding protein